MIGGIIKQNHWFEKNDFERRRRNFVLQVFIYSTEIQVLIKTKHIFQLEIKQDFKFILANLLNLKLKQLLEELEL
jgi:hypothetical protein